MFNAAVFSVINLTRVVLPDMLKKKVVKYNGSQRGGGAGYP